MKAIQHNWLDENAVTCRVFKGRWNIRHCLRMYFEIKDLKIEMATRGGGKVTRYESTYNPCRRCKVLAKRIKEISEEETQSLKFGSGHVNSEAMAS